MRMRLSGPLVLFAVWAIPTLALGDDAFKIEPLKQAPPSEVSAEIRADLNAQGYRVLKDGKPFAEFWFRKATPASAKPSGPNGVIQFPVLKEGQLLGALRYVEEGQDYRDQAIPVGVYTMRYGLQPVNGAHLGVSPFRDYALLLPAAKDKTLADLAQKPLEDRSSEAAGTSHPAVLMLLTPPSPVKDAPSMVQDEAKGTWGAAVSVPVGVKDSKDALSIDVQLVLSGAAAP